MVSPSNVFHIKQGDTAPVIEEYLRNADGTAIVLTGGSVEFHMADGDGTIKVNSAATVVDGPSGHVKYEWIAGDTDTAGTYYREWEATLASGRIVSTPNWTSYPVQIETQIA